MTDDDDLGWHALNYRTAAPQHAEAMWQALAACVDRKVAAERERAEKLAAWLQWCLDNCDDSPEHNFGTTAADHMHALLAGKPAPMPGN